MDDMATTPIGWCIEEPTKCSDLLLAKGVPEDGFMAQAGDVDRALFAQREMIET
jgi:hypothetical protein